MPLGMGGYVFVNEMKVHSQPARYGVVMVADAELVV